MKTLTRQRKSEAQLRQELQQIKAAQKDPRRFGVLYEKYYRQIFLFVYKRTHDEEVCGDIVSQVFLKAMASLKKYVYKGVPFSAWLYRIASNEVNQHYRNKKGERTISMEQTHVDRIMAMVDDDDGDERETRSYYLQVMIDTLQELKPEEVQIIELRFFEQRPFKEVAFILGITENNAKVRIYRILERLRKRLKKNLGGHYEA
ncbi:MAG: sigma-70 family RNA polymerase sigma factor [Bacteroidota bacterium]